MLTTADTQQFRMLLERSRDTALQRRAVLLYEALVEGLSSAAAFVLMRSRESGQLVFRISGGSIFRRVPGVAGARFLAVDVPVGYDRTSLMPLEQPQGATRYVLTWMPSAVRLPSGATSLSQVGLQELRDILTRAAKRDRSALLHELTHFVDLERLGPRAWRAASRGYRSDIEDPKRYANDPLELNAYYQQLATSERQEFDAALEGSDPVWDLWRWLDLDVKKATRQFTEKVMRSVWQRMTERNKRRFRKRAALFYDELRQQARRKVAELAALGDEDAQYALGEMST